MIDRQKNDVPFVSELISFFLFIIYIVAGQLVKHGENFFLKVAGIISLLLAIIFMFLPFYLLKKYGNPEKGKSYLYTQEVVDKGLYSVVRHPQYLGYIFLVLGFMLIDQNWINFTIGTVIIILLYLQAKAEEKYCLKRFGKRYVQYMKRVPRFNLLLGLYNLIKNR